MREAEYYNLGTATPPDEKLQKRRYVETLGTVHTKVWIELSQCDWMIADSQKHIEQLRSANNSEVGRVTWRPPFPMACLVMKPRTAMSWFERFLEQSQTRKARLEGIRKDVTSYKANSTSEVKGRPPEGPLSGCRIELPEAKADLAKVNEQELESASIDEVVLKEVAKDASNPNKR